LRKRCSRQSKGYGHHSACQPIPPRSAHYVENHRVIHRIAAAH